MIASLSEIGLTLLAAAAAGIAIGWLIRSSLASSRINSLNDDWQAQLDRVVRERDRFTTEHTTLRTSIEAQEAVIHQRDVVVRQTRTELESALEKEKLMTKNIFTLRAEREEFKTKVVNFQNALASFQRQSKELQTEFVKSGDFYKGQLAKSFETRKAHEEKIENSKKEHESFSNLLQSSRSEHESVNRMLASAKTRLKQLDALEENVIKLEAENAQLNHDARLSKQKIETLQRDGAEMDDPSL